MAANLLFFAQSARWMGKNRLNLEGDFPMKLGDLIGAPELEPLRKHLSVLRIAINEDFAGQEAWVRAGDEVAFLPPVSGG